LEYSIKPTEGFQVDIANQQSTELSSYIGKLLRDNFGKGPEAVYVSIGAPFIACYLRNFLSPTERVLMEEQQEDTVQMTRDLLMKKLIPEIKATMNFVTGMEIREFYYDWGLHNRSGMFLCISSDVLQSPEALVEEYDGKERIHAEITNISKQSEKAPAEIYSYQVNPRTTILVRNGILVSIEKQLIRDGYQEVLKLAKRVLEKKLLHNNNHFESIFNMKVVDVFVDWDFDLDKSVIVFITNPTR
jgi:uncharacterized protein YbcI